MRKTSQFIPRFCPATRRATEPGSGTNVRLFRRLVQSSTAPVCPSATTDASVERARFCRPAFHGPTEKPCRPTLRGHGGPALRLSGWRANGRLGHALLHDRRAFTGQQPTATLGEDVEQELHTAEAEAELQPDNVRCWERYFLRLRRRHGDDGVWAGFESMHGKGLRSLFSRPDSNMLRHEVLTAALKDGSRIAALVNVAQQLYTDDGFQWPNLHTKITHFCLSHARHQEAVRWHLQLAPNLPPATEFFGNLMSSFVVDPSPQMQRSLTTLYILSAERRLYDYIIPALFSAGQSMLARTWRSRLTLFNDLPATTKSRPFLRFIASYYPFIALTREELLAAGLGHSSYGGGDNGEPPQPATVVQDPSAGQYSDSLVAKWFASSWTSVEFAINLVHKLGLRVIGPRSLQSLALRESNAGDVASRITQLEQLGIEVASQTYCKALVFFAKRREEGLLKDLLNCDIHPDEFDDLERRTSLTAASIRQGDWKRARLFRGIKWATETGSSSSRRLDSLLSREMSERNMGKTRLVLDRMEALGLSMSQDSATRLLERTFDGLGEHPFEWACRVSDGNPWSLLDRAIDLIRRTACHDVAIPLHYWKLLLYNLGRLGRLDELQQLCMEVTQLYKPPHGGLVPVHQEDLPQLAGDWTAAREERPMLAGAEALATRTMSETEAIRKVDGDESPHDLLVQQIARPRKLGQGIPILPLPAEANANSPGPGAMPKDRESKRPLATEKSTDLADAKAYIPADLPFTHRQHPLQKLFNARLQRAIVRWGFDQTLATRPSAAALMDLDTSGIRKFDVACGVRLLALLREQGVLIDAQVVRSAVFSRIALAQVPGRRRERSRDKNEMSAKNMKSLVDEAWGSEVLPSLPEVVGELERLKPALWRRYPKLFGKAFDHGLRTSPE